MIVLYLHRTVNPVRKNVYDFYLFAFLLGAKVLYYRLHNEAKR
jgi:hypothetical protein